MAYYYESRDPEKGKVLDELAKEYLDSHDDPVS